MTSTVVILPPISEFAPRLRLLRENPAYVLPRSYGELLAFIAGRDWDWVEEDIRGANKSEREAIIQAAAFLVRGAVCLALVGDSEDRGERLGDNAAAAFAHDCWRDGGRDQVYSEPVLPAREELLEYAVHIETEASPATAAERLSLWGVLFCAREIERARAGELR